MECWIVRYDTHSGGGVAFVPKKYKKSQVVENVKKYVSHQYECVYAEIIGKSKNIDTATLKQPYYYNENGEFEYIDIYFYGGDCC